MIGFNKDFGEKFGSFEVQLGKYINRQMISSIKVEMVECSKDHPGM